MHLYELSREYQTILNDINQDGGDNSPLILQRLDEIKAPLEQKVINIAKYTRQLENDAAAVKSEIERLKGMLASIQSREEQLYNYLETNMRACNINRIDSPLFKVTFRKNPPRVEILNEDHIPDEYKKIKSEVVIDKEKIRDELKNGVVIPGTALIKAEKLVIK